MQVSLPPAAAAHSTRRGPLQKREQKTPTNVDTKMEQKEFIAGIVRLAHAMFNHGKSPTRAPPACALRLAAPAPANTANMEHDGDD